MIVFIQKKGFPLSNIGSKHYTLGKQNNEVLVFVLQSSPENGLMRDLLGRGRGP